MQILYISVLASSKTLEEARQRNPQLSGYSMQKFSRLVVEGLTRNGQQVTALSTFYQSSDGLFWSHRGENEGGVKYKYIVSPKYEPLRHLWLTIYSFFYILKWGFFNKKDKVLVCDVLRVSACLGAVAAARLIGLRRVGIMTDMPGLMVSRSKKNIKRNRILKTSQINKSFLAHFTHYVFLTEKMNEAINVNRRPYIVMEGLVDADMPMPNAEVKENKRVVLYAGGLHERYGLKMLVDGFIAADVENAELWLYGDGPFADELPEYMQRDSRIHYFGIRPNHEIVEAECRATLLVNPRPTHEEFTLYSFPSKNMEYMVSGTPVLTTKLPGMPTEYYPYVYLFDQGETTEGYASVLHKVLSLPASELQTKGENAYKWVLDYKNHIIQTNRILQLVNS